MKRFFALVAVCIIATGCTVTRSNLAADVGKPAIGSRVLLIKPDVELGVLTAAGSTEPRADWSKSGSENLASEIEHAVQGKSHPLIMLDPSSAMDGRSGQILRLNAALAASIQTFTYGPLKLPTKGAALNWTLGDGARAIGEEKADYALFIVGRGNYASSGRVAVMVGMSLLGVGVPLGNQQVSASLVDLHTGKVVWFNMALAGPNADMRQAVGAQSLVASLLKDAPL